MLKKCLSLPSATVFNTVSNIRPFVTSIHSCVYIFLYTPVRFSSPVIKTTLDPTNQRAFFKVLTTVAISSGFNDAKPIRNALYGTLPVL